MKTYTITKQELIELVSNLSGATPASIITTTEKRITGLGDVIKISHANIMIGASYAKGVNRVLEKQGQEPDFTPTKRTWGERVGNTPIIRHHDKVYLEARILRDCGHLLRSLDGKILNQKDKPTSELVKLRDYNLENIKEIRISGRKFAIK